MTNQEQLDLVRKAIADILSYGQENQHGDRQITRARLDYLMELERRLVAESSMPENLRINFRNRLRNFEPI
jgi:hypothetical protein